MKTLKQLLVGGAIGFIVTFTVLKGFTFDFSKYADTVVLSLFVIIVILLGLSLLLYRQISNLNNTAYEGDEEDEVDVKKYKKFTDYSLFIHSSLTLSLLALTISIIVTKSTVFIILSISALIVCNLFMTFMHHLMKLVYPDRNLPSLSAPNYTEKLLEVADEGEKHVILNGLYKSYSLLSIALVVAIAVATFYSISTDNSQLFSIIAMCIVLLIVNGKYLLAIRNK